MGNYLSDAERHAITAANNYLKDFNHLLCAPSWDNSTLVVDGYAGEFAPGGYSDVELSRLASAFADSFGCFNRRLNNQDAAIVMIIECAEQVRLPVIEVLKTLEDLPKRKKSIPSIAEFSEVFKERKELLRQILNDSRDTISNYRDEADKAFEALVEAMDEIRGFLPDFPEPEDFTKLWERTFNAPFPIYEFGSDIRTFKKKMINFRTGLQAGDFWPAVPLYCIYLALQIPTEKVFAAIDYVENLIDEDGQYFVSCELPMHWRSAIAEISNISLDAQSIDLWEGFDPVEAIHIMLDDCYRDRLNASWQAKLGATPSIPQPIPQR